MEMKDTFRILTFWGSFTFFCLLQGYAQTTVLGEQKVSDTQGSFTGNIGDGEYFAGDISNIGDLDNDGVVDLVVGEHFDSDPGAQDGSVWIMFMNADGTVKNYQKISNNEGGLGITIGAGDYFGSGCTGIGDLDGDGNEDIAVGAKGCDDGGTDRGSIYILFLESDGTVDDEQKISDTQGNFAGVLDNDDDFGRSIANIGDLDGDGNTELAVGAPLDDDGGTDKGALYILFMDANGTVKSEQKISDTQGGFTGTLTSSGKFGMDIEGIGDLDGDGIEDIAVANMYDNDGGTDRGAFWILFLNTNGTVKSYQKISDTQGGFTGDLDNGDRFGRSIAKVGDIDGDEVDDLAVGSYYDDDGGTDRGAVFILLMNSDGTVKHFKKISSTIGGFTGPLSNSDNFGVSVTGIGDLDGDSRNDIAVGAFFDDDGGTNTGAFYVLFLDGEGTYTTIASGNFTDPAVWDCNCVPTATENIVVNNGHMVTLNTDATVNDVDIATGGNLYLNNNVLTVNGDFILNGIINGTDDIELNGQDTKIDGSGSISNISFLIINGNKTIVSGSTISQLAGEFKINGNDTIVNRGTYTIVNGELLANSPNALWINSTNARLNAGNDVLKSMGMLDASASGNVVNYYGSSDQVIKTPVGAYYHLHINGNDEKKMSADLDVNGDIDIGGTAWLDVDASFTINLAGDFINNSGAADGFMEQNGEVIFDGIESQSIINLGGGEMFFRLTINKPNDDVMLGSSIFVANELNMILGDIVLGSNSLTVLPTASIGGTPGPSSYIQAHGNGTLNYQFAGTFFPVSFPVGDNMEYSPFNADIITAVPSGGSQQLQLKLTDAKLPSLTSATDHITRYWILNATGFSTIIYNVNYYYADSDIVGNENNLIAVKYDGLAFESLEPVAPGLNRLFSISGINTIPVDHEFTGSSADGFILPITLLDFEAELVQQRVNLLWTTGSETDNDFFEVERSGDGDAFESLANIPSLGNSNTAQEYHFIDYHPLRGISYYRLKQTDKNGQFSYSPMVRVDNSATAGQMQLFPNPASGDENIMLEIRSEEPVIIDIYDTNGKLIYTRHFSAASRIRLDRQFHSGLFLVNARTDKQVLYRKTLLIQ